MKKAFDETYSRILTSKAYSKYCQAVYGYSLLQLNLVDDKQLEVLLSLLNLTEGSKVLDLGCGLGAITKYIAEHTGAFVSGVDLSSEAIEFAKKLTSETSEKTKSSTKDKLKFYEGDIETFPLEANTLDAIVSIDSFMFVKDLDNLLKNLIKALKPQGQIAILYTQSPLFHSKGSLDPHSTLVSGALKSNNLPYKVQDFTEQGKKVCETALTYCNLLKEDFIAEGNEALYITTKRTAQRMLESLLNGSSKKYLYYAKKQE